jgi:carboxypeptidase C (cathepsin A)
MLPKRHEADQRFNSQVRFRVCRTAIPHAASKIGFGDWGDGEMETPMNEAADLQLTQQQMTLQDYPLDDPTPYGYGKDDSVSDTSEKAAITHKKITLNGTTIFYTARAGHLVTTDPYSAQPAAKIFYVAFTADGTEPSKRPVTFFYNGGPGSSSVYLLLGSFGPRRIKTRIDNYTPPAPYVLRDNQECLLDRSDLVFINPVGTAYSTAVAPRKNSEFWGVDEDARSIRQFVKRYLTLFNRWNSPKFLFGESYGTPRTCVLTWLLHEDGVDLNGIILQSSVLDYSAFGNPIGLLPTFAADAWSHVKVTVSPTPPDLPTFMAEVAEFARTDYAAARATFPKVDRKVVSKLSHMLGIPSDVLTSWKLDPASHFLTTLLKDDGYALGAYDGRFSARDTGIAGSVKGNDPALMAVGGVYTAMWNVYLNEELQYVSACPFLAQNDQVGPNWNFVHVDPAGQKAPDNLYTAGDLAAAMELNPYLKVFSASGYFDAVAPFFQTLLTLQNMPIGNDDARKNLEIRNYESGHMIYLDDKARSEMKAHLAEFYEDATKPQEELIRIRPNVRHMRRIGRTLY